MVYQPYQLVSRISSINSTSFFLSAQGPLEPHVAYPNNQGILISCTVENFTDVYRYKFQHKKILVIWIKELLYIILKKK